LEKRVLTVISSNSKNKRLRNVPINDVAFEVLQRVWTRGEHEYVFVNRRTGAPYTTIAKQWGRIRQRAGLPKLRIHDLRHTFCSYLSASGVDLWTIATLAGHAGGVKTTARYAHIPSKALANAANVMAMKISGGDAFAGMSKASQ
jgi:integrase